MAIGKDEWELRDLHSEYNEDLFLRFYELIESNFPLVEEREPIETWRQALLDNKDSSSYLSPAETHIIIPMSPLMDPPVIGGGLVLEYHPVTNNGLITYLVVDEICRGQGMGRRLVEKAVEMLDEFAKQRGHLTGCNAVFLETNSPSKISESQDVMIPRDRQIVYQKLGFKLVDIPYMVPPLGPQQSKMDFLSLMVLITPHIPSSPTSALQKQKEHYLPSSILKGFLWGLWHQSYDRKYLDCPPNKDPDYITLIQEVDQRENIPLMNII